MSNKSNDIKGLITMFIFQKKSPSEQSSEKKPYINKKIDNKPNQNAPWATTHQLMQDAKEFPGNETQKELITNIPNPNLKKY